MATRRRYHHGDLAEALLAATERLVAEKGVAAFSLREAARVVGVDPAACYRHFRDRDDVLHALARRGFTKLATAMEQAIARRREPLAVLRVLGRSYVEFARANPSEYRVMFGPNGVPARDPRLRGVHARSPYEITFDAVRAWRGPELADAAVERITNTLWAAVHGVASLVVDGAWRDEREADAILNALLDRLLA